MTNVGMILGTAGYMSPEQARGQEVDKRTDIWAFGCVLFEMLTRKQVFGGETVTDILGAIVHKEPDWKALPESTPQGIQRLLRRCLEKDPHNRLHHIADARIEIRQAQTEPVGPTLEPVAPVVASSSWRWAILGGIIGLAGSIAGVFLWNLADHSQPRQPTVAQFPVVLPEGATLRGYLLALSPDGTQLVYAAHREGTRQLYVRALDQLESKPIPHTEGAMHPFFSPDGKWVGFFALEQAALKKVSLMGGTPQTLCEVRVSRGGSWGQDGTIVFGETAGGLWRVSDAGGTPKELTRGPCFRPQILPGGKAVIFNRLEKGGTSITVLSLKTSEEQVLIKRGRSPRYAPSGHLIYALDEKLLAAPFDLKTLKVTGDSKPVLEGLWSTVGSEQYSISENGTLAYIPRGDPARSGNRLSWVDRQGEQQAVTEMRRDFSSVRFSPDGKRLAVALGSFRDAEIWIYEIARGILSPLTTGGGFSPIWTPEGTRLAFGRQGSQTGLFWKAADGSGEVEQLTTEFGLPFSWSPDGNLLAFGKIDPSLNQGGL